MTKDKQIAALRAVIAQMLDLPASASAKARIEAEVLAHVVYCATAPEWQKTEALALAKTLPAPGCSELKTYEQAINACGRSILTATERY